MLVFVKNHLSVEKLESEIFICSVDLIYFFFKEELLFKVFSQLHL